ncbi:sulfotransferase 1C4-like isoform X2 [Penaeus monodon]|uniref:sulfotransferase 1C4-like isoform X2 n=1 Tax=Penaeus monodon TaxID=6687 RepID=UPI0018A79050|nr:sulfotransferase 1C4-like isoform X2 [Penaeus monodon]
MIQIKCIRLRSYKTRWSVCACVMVVSKTPSLDSGHTASALEGEEWDSLRKDFPSYHGGLVRISPGRWLYPTRFCDLGNKLYNFKFRKDDVLVMTWPKCGTTWTQEIVWTMRNNPDLDNPEADAEAIDRVPFIDVDMFMPVSEEMVSISKAFKTLCPGADLRDGEMIQLAEAMASPRTMKTHLPFSLISPDVMEHAKVVYVARNPKDTMVSYLHHHRLFREQEFVGSLESFVDYFVKDDLVYGPYWLHLKEAWQRRDHPNLHFVFYEDLKADIKGELKKLDAFLGTGLSEDQLANVAKYTSFGEMKAREEKNLDKDYMNNDAFVNQDVRKKDGGFFRQGKAGDWKNKLTPELVGKMEDWISQKCDFGINFA